MCVTTLLNVTVSVTNYNLSWIHASLLRCFGGAAVDASGVGRDLFRVGLHLLIVGATLDECVMLG